ncbi:hypothetical protein JR316_0006601 [Psilocybe cubensis]|uniref:Uncharacterized protein n=2 Tax=Psilocybe cubensis TaxID=181762 RepID=A0ACB8GF62_PSICU|nr:uncharacterized protein JR316_0013531 [Psilocybe cubensis]XP_047747629.1 hypothetical protein JR316_0006601 [Psilocybe cubensis]KAH9474181.1 hypothetical protein JR316_0013531 [Psilocybe cubensis]KAH9480004.1 hypothetical protein JR316_0006601 [Psilocybe cubensis]
MPTQSNPDSSDHKHSTPTIYAIDPNNFPEISPPSATNTSDEESSGSDESSDDGSGSNDSPDDGSGDNKSSGTGSGDDESSNNGSESADEQTIPLNDKGKGKQKVNLAVNDNSFVPPPDFDSSSEDAQSVVAMQTSRSSAQFLAPKPSATISSAITAASSSTELQINEPTAEETPTVPTITPIISYTSVVDSIILESRPMVSTERKGGRYSPPPEACHLLLRNPYFRTYGRPDPMGSYPSGSPPTAKEIEYDEVKERTSYFNPPFLFNYTEQQLRQSHDKIKHTRLGDNSYLNKATTLKNLTLNQLQTQILYSNALSEIDDGIAIVENDLETLIKYSPA